MYGHTYLPAHLHALSGRMQLKMLLVLDLYFQDNLSHLNQISEIFTTRLHCQEYVCFDYSKKQPVSVHGDKIPVHIHIFILIGK